MNQLRDGPVVIITGCLGGIGRAAALLLYCGSKFALEAISDALRQESRPFGMHVIVAEPGSTKTSFQQASACSSGRFATNTSSPCHRYFEPFGRLIERTGWSSSPETVANAIVCALTADRPQARYRATPQARLMLAFAPLLPGKLRDAHWSRLLGPHAPRGSAHRRENPGTVRRLTHG